MHARLATLFIAITLTGQKLSAETETRSANAGETVSLRCDVAHEKQTLWFGQRCGEAPFLGVSASSKGYDARALFAQFVRGADPRLAVEFDAAAESVLLKIENVTEGDAALYFCASMRRGSLYFGNGTKIVISGSEHDPPPSLLPPDCVLCCVHLTFVSVVCVVVCTLGLCYCIRQMLKKKSPEDKGLSVASGMKRRTRRTAT